MSILDVLLRSWCSGKIFWPNGDSIGWDALEDLDDDELTARSFVVARLCNGPGGDEPKTETVEVWIKDKLGAPVRSVHKFTVQLPVRGKILTYQRVTNEP